LLKLNLNIIFLSIIYQVEIMIGIIKVDKIH
jgi:hypothetical protein